MKKYILLFLIVILAGALRFWQLGSNPPSLTWDEAAWGYNAYSLSASGRDEFGRFLPLDYLESFGDYKPPVYAYLDTIPVRLFGLNEFATRLPSALLGTLTVLVAYFMVKRIFEKSPLKDWIALASAFILAVSPWHIMLSRAAFEANVATFFIGCGVWLFLKAIQSNKWYLSASIACFVLSMYTFNTARVVSPLLVIVLGLVQYKQLWKSKKETILAIIVGIILLMPTIPFLLSPQAKLRFQEVNIFSDVSLIQQSNQEVANDTNVWWSKALHNRRLVYTAAFLRHYFDNLNPLFLFIKGDGNPKFSTQDVGELYIWDIPFFIVGALLLFKKREGVWWLVPLWLLLGIIPAATARETPHALRIEATVPTFQILVAYGFVSFVFFVNKYRRFVLTTAMIFLAINVVYYLHGYYSYYPTEFSGEWQYGYKDALHFTQAVQNKYQHIEFTDQLGRPYIYYLFYTQLPSSQFRQTANITRDVFGFVHVNSVGKYSFGKDLPVQAGTLYVNIPSSVPKNAQIQKTFYLLNGEPSLVAYTL